MTKKRILFAGLFSAIVALGSLASSGHRSATGPTPTPASSARTHPAPEPLLSWLATPNDVSDDVSDDVPDDVPALLLPAGAVQVDHVNPPPPPPAMYAPPPPAPTSPPNPATNRPPRDNPGGVNSDRPARPVPGLD